MLRVEDTENIIPMNTIVMIFPYLCLREHCATLIPRIGFQA